MCIYYFIKGENLTPPVTSDDLANSRIVLESDPTAVANAVKELLVNRETRLKLGCNGRKFVESHFSLSDMGYAYANAYLSALAYES